MLNLGDYPNLDEDEKPAKTEKPANACIDMFADEDIPEEVLTKAVTIATMDASNHSMKGLFER
jgi:hypothetical protein